MTFEKMMQSLLEPGKVLKSVDFKEKTVEKSKPFKQAPKLIEKYIWGTYRIRTNDTWYEVRVSSGGRMCRIYAGTDLSFAKIVKEEYEIAHANKLRKPYNLTRRETHEY